MGSDDDRRATLDPGLTALALRARRNAGSRYPFVDEAARPRAGWIESLKARLGAWRRRGRPAAGRDPRPRPPA